MTLPAFGAYSGGRSTPRILFVGEAWGAEEEQLETPFVGAAGRLLFQLLGEIIPDEPGLYAEAERHLYGVGFRRRRDEWAQAVGVGFTNVLGLRPQDNDLTHVTELKGDLPPDYPKGLLRFPMIRSPAGRFLRSEFFGELGRLREEVERASPNLVVPLGNSALWAFDGSSGIGSKRGVVAWASDCVLGGLGRPTKFLPTYHPAAVLRNYAWRALLKADLIKAWRESSTPQIVRPERYISISPSIEDIQEWLSNLVSESPSLLSCDIETKAGQITCIGFAPSRSKALVIPFWSLDRTSPHYWSSPSAEVAAWKLTQEILGSETPKLFQNGMYDLQYILRAGLRPRAVLHDTMLMHHAMFPELQKGLGFLASIYTSESSWKLMRLAKSDVEKADE